MRWGWVHCLACNPNEEERRRGVNYKHVSRSAAEIAQRAELANSKASYKALPQKLGGIKKANEDSGPTAHHDGVPNDQLTKLLEQVGKLTEQVSELLAENRALRKKLDEQHTIGATTQ